MDIRSRLRLVATNRIFTLILAVVANVSALLGIAQFFGLSPASPLIQIGTFAFTALVGGFVFWASYITHLENNRLKRCAAEFHQINHCYRDALCEVFYENRSFDDNDLLSKEREVLKDVSRKIGNVFWYLTNRKCMVTVYLLVEDNETVTFSWAISELDTDRDQKPVRKFNISENTRFSEAVNRRSTGPSRFFGADLPRMNKDNRYQDLTPGWERLYRSCIVVPIRYFKTKSEGHVESSSLGFLMVDTMDKHRLNDDFHIQYLAGFADQMYNFISLMRGRYQLRPDVDGELTETTTATQSKTE